MLHLQIYIGIVAIAIILAMLTVWSRKDYRTKWVAILLAGIVVFSAKPALDLLLGLPKVMSTEWIYKNAKEALVVGMYIKQSGNKKNLFLYLVLPGVDAPRSYVLPWNKQTKKLAGTINQRAKEGKKTKIKNPFTSDPRNTYKVENPVKRDVIRKPDAPPPIAF